MVVHPASHGVSVHRGTQAHNGALEDFGYGAITLSGRSFQNRSPIRQRLPCVVAAARVVAIDPVIA